jgi:Ca2+-binding EF-hand superfamily protein
MRPFLLLTLPACALALSACSTTETIPGSSSPLPGAEPASVWEFLEAKYDTDGDGQVNAAEYDRGSETFGRLDRNGDGNVTEADFSPREGRGMGMTPERMAPMILVRCFQRDDDPALSRDEFREALAELDTDDDGRLSASEAEPAFTDLRGMIDRDFHAMLLAVADDSGDGELTEFELLLLFDRTDEDNDGSLSSMGRRGGPGSHRGSEAPGEAEPEGEPPPAAQGNVAPDFSLKPVSGDGDPVRLSSFQGDRPVALIFGSYT